MSKGKRGVPLGHTASPLVKTSCYESSFQEQGKNIQQVAMTWYSGFAYTMFLALDNLRPSQCRLTNSYKEIWQNMQQQTESKQQKLEIFFGNISHRD